MLLIRTSYRTYYQAGACICVPVREKYSLFHFPEPVEIRIGDTLYETKPDAVIISRPDEPRWFHFPKGAHFSFLHATLDIGPLLEKYSILFQRIILDKVGIDAFHTVHFITAQTKGCINDLLRKGRL